MENDMLYKVSLTLHLKQSRLHQLQLAYYSQQKSSMTCNYDS